MATTQLLQSAHTVASSLAPSLGSSTAASASKSTSSSSTSSSASANGDITSNDFLTLLVSELKNQDPTQPTDPNAYVQQLVGVNSLQQLIDINQGITKIDGTSSSTPSTNANGITGSAVI